MTISFYGGQKFMPEFKWSCPASYGSDSVQERQMLQKKTSDCSWQGSQVGILDKNATRGLGLQQRPQIIPAATTLSIRSTPMTIWCSWQIYLTYLYQVCIWQFSSRQHFINHVYLTPLLKNLRWHLLPVHQVHLLYGSLQLGKEQTGFARVIQLFLQSNFWTNPQNFTALNPNIFTIKCYLILELLKNTRSNKGTKTSGNVCQPMRNKQKELSEGWQNIKNILNIEHQQCLVLLRLVFLPQEKAKPCCHNCKDCFLFHLNPALAEGEWGFWTVSKRWVGRKRK